MHLISCNLKPLESLLVSQYLLVSFLIYIELDIGRKKKKEKITNVLNYSK